MTPQVHEHAAHGGRTHEDPGSGGEPMIASRPRWLLPGLVVAVIVGSLVVAGVVSLSTVFYAGLFGGMMLMHMGGHGHGGHGGGGAGRGHSLHGDGADDAEVLSRRSSDAQTSEPGSSEGLDQRVRPNSTTSETDDHDQHNSHGCH